MLIELDQISIAEVDHFCIVGNTNGKSLELDFLVKSEKVEPSVFHSMKKIKTQAELIRNNPIASAKKAREPIKLPKAGSLTVYSPTEKTVIFFSPFREKSYGDTYRYQ